MDKAIEPTMELRLVRRNPPKGAKVTFVELKTYPGAHRAWSRKEHKRLKTPDGLPYDAVVDVLLVELQPSPRPMGSRELLRREKRETMRDIREGYPLQRISEPTLRRFAEVLMEAQAEQNLDDVGEMPYVTPDNGMVA